MKDDYQLSYVYQITHLPSGVKYIGSRWSSCLTYDTIYQDLGHTYFSSSSSYLFSKSRQREFPNEYKYNVLRYFRSAYDAQLCEEVLHEYFDVAKNPLFENKHKAKADKYNFPYLQSGQCVVYNELTKKFEVIFIEDKKDYHIHKIEGKKPVKNLFTGETKWVDVDEELTEEWVHVTKGKKTVKNLFTGETKWVDVDEELNEEWVHIHHGTVNIVDNDGNTRKITSEQYKNGTYQTKTTNKVTVRDIKEKGDWKLIESSEYDKNLYETPMKNKITAYDTIIQKTVAVNKNDPRFDTGELEKIVPVKGGKGWVTQSEYRTGNYESVLSKMATLTKNGKTITIPCEDVPKYKDEGWRGVGSLSVFTPESFAKRKQSLEKIDENGLSGYDKRSKNYSNTVLEIGEDGLTIAQKRSMKIAETRKNKIGKLKLFDSKGTLVDVDYLLDLSKTYGIPRHYFDKCLHDKKGFFSNRPNVAKKKGLERFIGWYVEKE